MGPVRPLFTLQIPVGGGRDRPSWSPGPASCVSSLLADLEPGAVGLFLRGLPTCEYRGRLRATGAWIPEFGVGGWAPVHHGGGRPSRPGWANPWQTCCHCHYHPPALKASMTHGLGRPLCRPNTNAPSWPSRPAWQICVPNSATNPSLCSVQAGTPSPPLTITPASSSERAEETLSARHRLPCPPGAGPTHRRGTDRVTALLGGEYTPTRCRAPSPARSPAPGAAGWP